MITSLCPLTSDSGCQTLKVLPVPLLQTHHAVLALLQHVVQLPSVLCCAILRAEEGVRAASVGEMLKVERILMCTGADQSFTKGFGSEGRWQPALLYVLIKTALLCWNNSRVFGHFAYLLCSVFCAYLSTQERVASVPTQADLWLAPTKQSLSCLPSLLQSTVLLWVNY